jgi:peroxiredoxin
LGDKLPSLVLRDNEGKDVKVDELTAEKGVIIFLYPKVGVTISS